MPLNTRKCNSSRFASENPFDILEVSHHVTWAPLDPDFEPEPLPPTHSFYTSFPGEIRNAIYAHLLGLIPENQEEVFGHEVTLESDDMEKPRLHAVVLHEYGRKIPHLVNLGLTCSFAAGEVFSMMKSLVGRSLVLVVNLDILQNTSFNLKTALENLPAHQPGTFDVIPLVEKATIRLIWPEDNLEYLYLGNPDFFKGLRCVPKRLQMQVSCSPWSPWINHAKVDFGSGGFICQGGDALFNRSHSQKGSILLAWKKSIYKITTFERNQSVGTDLDLGEHLRTQCKAWFVRTGKWNDVRRRWEGFSAGGGWWEKKDLGRRFQDREREMDTQEAEEHKEKWGEKCIADYGLLE